MKIIKRKVVGMPKAIRGFGHIFSQKVIRRMAIVTSRHVFMRGFLPTVILFIHNMTIGTG